MTSQIEFYVNFLVTQSTLTLPKTRQFNFHVLQLLPSAVRSVQAGDSAEVKQNFMNGGVRIVFQC